MRGRAPARPRTGMRLTAARPLAQQLVGALLHPPGHVGVGGPAVGRVVLEAAVLGRVVRGRDHDAVREMRGAAAVVHENRVRDHRGRGHAVVALDDGLDPVGGQHLERGALGGPRYRVGVLAEEERPVDPLPAPVVADRLGGGEDVGLGERAAQGRAAVAAGAEADQLGLGLVHVGPARVVLALEPRGVDQQRRARAGRRAGRSQPRPSRRARSRDSHYVTGHA